MELTLGQVFYGVGPGGYAVQGASPAAKGLVDEAVSLSGRIGSPECIFEGERILASKPMGDHVIMGCLQKGPKDFIGRRTVFFHALVAKADELEASGHNAFTLFDRELFSGAVPEGGVSDLAVPEMSRGSDAAEPSPAIEYPAVIRLKKPDPGVVRKLLGPDANNRSWATFADMFSLDFDLCAVGQYADIPGDRFVYDESGKLIRGKIAEAEDERDHGQTAITTGGLALKLSLIVNVVLAVVVAIMFMRKLGKQSRFADVEEAVENFKLENRIDFKVEDASADLKGIGIVQHINDTLPRNPHIGDRIKANIDFANKIFEAMGKPNKRKENQP